MTTPPSVENKSPSKSASAADVTSPSGLTSEEARRRWEKFGPNAMPDTALHPLRMAIEKFWAPTASTCDDGVRGVRRQIVLAETFRMVSAARQRGALRRIPDAIFLIGVPAMRVGRHRAGNRACPAFLTRAALVATFANHSAT
jgi:Cation transporter/ATPase, N-terminus